MSWFRFPKVGKSGGRLSPIFARMQYWLFKSEPDSYGFDRLESDGQTEWSGVRNYQARNFMKTMKLGDLGFFYHSSTAVPGIVGTCRIIREAYVDETAQDPKSPYFDSRANPEKPIWEMVDVAFGERFNSILALEFLRTQPKLSSMTLLQKGQRLSVQPVSTSEWNTIMKLAKRS